LYKVFRNDTASLFLIVMGGFFMFHAPIFLLAWLGHLPLFNTRSGREISQRESLEFAVILISIACVLHAINSVTTPTLRFQPRKKSRMIQRPSAGVGSGAFF
jgi:hypothetical protein